MNKYILFKDCFSWRANFLVATMLFATISTHEVVAKNNMSTAPEVDSSISGTYRNNQVLLRRTSHGVVYVTASDYAGIGYGVGYAYTPRIIVVCLHTALQRSMAVFLNN
jgi:acyl-homoserine lactone acylase PvdQ